MNLALTVDCWQDEQLIFAQQFGVAHIVAETTLPDGEGFTWDARTLTALRNRVEQAGLTLAGLDLLPQPIDSLVRGDANRDEEIAAVCGFVRDAGKAGLPCIGYVWRAARRVEPQPRREGRGGVGVQFCGGDLPGQSDEAESSWENLAYFLERVIPVAEEAGGRMVFRPPNLFEDAGASNSRLGSARGLKRVLETAPSFANALDIWPCAMAAQEGIDSAEAVRALNANGKIALVTVQNLCGRLPEVAEACIDEGDTEVLATLRACREAGYDGLLRPGPQPAMTDDTPWGHIAQAFAIGYLRSLLQESEHSKRTRA